MLKNITLGVAVLALILAGFSFTKDSVVKETIREIAVGAAAGPDHYVHENFNAGMTVGGRVATTTALATWTTQASDLNGTPTYWDILGNVNTTVSLSATSTHAYIPRVGDTAKLYVRNASSTAASTVIFAAADAGLDLQFAEATGGDLTLNGLDFAELTLIRESANLVSVLFNEFTEGD